MSLAYSDFIARPQAREEVTHALAEALHEELDYISDGEYVQHMLPPKSEARLLLRDSHCGRTCLALYQYWGGEESPVELLRVPPEHLPHNPGMRMAHVVLGDKANITLIDPTWSQFYAWVGVTPARVMSGELPCSVYNGAPEIAVIPQDCSAQFSRSVATRAFTLDQAYSAGGPLSGQSREKMYSSYRQIWEAPKLVAYDFPYGLRIAYSADRITNRLRALTRG